MKIFMFHPHDIYCESEPWTIRIVSLARQFAKKGHDVRLGYFLFDSSKAPESLEGIETIPFDRKISPVTFIKNIIKIYREIARADIVHFQKCHHYASVPVLIACLLRAKPVHYDWDDWEKKIFIHSNKLTPTIALVYCFFNILERLIPESVDTISVSSRKLYDLCLKMGLPRHRIFMAPVGADLKIFNCNISGEAIKRKFNLKGPVVLYLGQLHGGQYVELFIRAAGIVLKNSCGVNFMIVGGGSRFEEMRRLAAEEGVQENVIFTNSLPHDMIPECIAAADVCVACFEENDITVCKSPLKVAEYLASGKAVVASNVGEVRNMVGGAGLLTQAGNVNELACSIKRFLDEPDLRKEMGRLARKRSQTKYNWEVTADNVLAAYQTALVRNNKWIEEILIPARDFVRGNVSRHNDNFGSGLLIDAASLPCCFEYEFYVPSDGLYELWVKFAGQLSRPCDIYFDGKLLSEAALSETTGGWTIKETQWFKQTQLRIESDFHSLKFLCEGCCPHVQFIKLKKKN